MKASQVKKEERREVGQREERTYILAILFQTKSINNDKYPLAGEQEFLNALLNCK